VLYTVRAPGSRFRPPVFSNGPFTVKVGRDQPDGPTLRALEAGSEKDARTVRVKILF
jgi:hypothetical protein